MTYIDSVVTPLHPDQLEPFLEMEQKFADYICAHGALSFVEAIADDVPKGEVTDFYRSIQAKEGETVLVSFVTWPDKETRDAAWGKMMDDPAFKDMMPENMPFDGKRMFWGGFKPVIER